VLEPGSHELRAVGPHLGRSRDRRRERAHSELPAQVVAPAHEPASDVRAVVIVARCEPRRGRCRRRGAAAVGRPRIGRRRRIERSGIERRSASVLDRSAVDHRIASARRAADVAREIAEPPVDAVAVALTLDVTVLVGPAPLANLAVAVVRAASHRGAAASARAAGSVLDAVVSGSAVVARLARVGAAPREAHQARAAVAVDHAGLVGKRARAEAVLVAQTLQAGPAVAVRPALLATAAQPADQRNRARGRQIAAGADHETRTLGAAGCEEQQQTDPRGGEVRLARHLRENTRALTIDRELMHRRERPGVRSVSMLNGRL
jgi:hypothetical protein